MVGAFADIPERVLVATLAHPVPKHKSLQLQHSQSIFNEY
jgi:hypothetical protein